jgi:hypothetical protein
MSKRYEVGTLDGQGNFQADGIGDDPELTAFDTWEEACLEVREAMAHAEKCGEPLTNAAIHDSQTCRVAPSDDRSTGG